MVMNSSQPLLLVLLRRLLLGGFLLTGVTSNESTGNELVRLVVVVSLDEVMESVRDLSK